MPLLITYDPSLVPDGGIEIASQVSLVRDGCGPTDGRCRFDHCWCFEAQSQQMQSFMTFLYSRKDVRTDYV